MKGLIGSFPSFIDGAYNDNNSNPSGSATFLILINAFLALVANRIDGFFINFS
jgi:hypothetical protein